MRVHRFIPSQGCDVASWRCGLDFLHCTSATAEFSVHCRKGCPPPDRDHARGLLCQRRHHSVQRQRPRLRPHVRATSQLQRSIKEQHQRDDASLSSLPTMSCHLFSCALGCYRDPRSTRVARTLLCLRTDRCPLVFQACTWCVALASLAGRPAAQNVSVSR